MKESLRTLQTNYVATLRSVAPAILAWWDERCPYPATAEIAPEAMTDFHRRWPAGPAGHPRILAIFRDHFFAVEEINDEAPSRERVKPIDLLVNDMATVAPDLFAIMQGLLFVPIGIDPDGRDC